MLILSKLKEDASRVKWETSHIRSLYPIKYSLEISKIARGPASVPGT